ncbi:MAG: hypothetical protein GX616_24330 [Planctomycetes bacterium]|nr:hypothetical protein [Planctomycetota bacterium]
MRDHRHHGGHHGHSHGRHAAQPGHGPQQGDAAQQRYSPRAHDLSAQAIASPTGESCPKRGGTGECQGDCRACAYRTN